MKITIEPEPEDKEQPEPIVLTGVYVYAVCGRRKTDEFGVEDFRTLTWRGINEMLGILEITRQDLLDKKLEAANQGVLAAIGNIAKGYWDKLMQLLDKK